MVIVSLLDGQITVPVVIGVRVALVEVAVGVPVVAPPCVKTLRGRETRMTRPAKMPCDTEELIVKAKVIK